MTHDERRELPRALARFGQISSDDIAIAAAHARLLGAGAIVVSSGGDEADDTIRYLVTAAAVEDLRLIISLDLRVVPADASVAIDHPHWFERAWRGTPPDPREQRSTRAVADDVRTVSALAHAGNAFVDFWATRLLRWAHLGVAGIVVRPVAFAPAGGWTALLPRLRDEAPGLWVAIDGRGASAAEVGELGGSDFDAALSSFRWWNGVDAWYFEEDARLRRCARTIVASVDASFAQSQPRYAHPAATTELASVVAEALILEVDATAPASTDREGSNRFGAFNQPGTLFHERRPLLRDRRDGLVALLGKATGDTPAELLLANLDHEQVAQVVVADIAAQSGLGYWTVRDGTPLEANAILAFGPGEYARLRASTPPPAKLQRPAPLERSSAVAARIAIEAVTPVLDNGRFAVKRCVGDRIGVEADIFADGHDHLAAAILWRRAGEQAWRRAPMALIDNDRWSGSFQVDRCGRHEFMVEVWRDDFATLRDEIGKKLRAGVLEPIDIADARVQLDGVRLRSRSAAAPMKQLLVAFDAADDDAARAQIVLSAVAAAEVGAASDHPFATRSDVFPVEVDRQRARYANWYELFPRSSRDAGRHGTFDDVIEELPGIRAMGFDVLYMPPIHPIGTSHRKGRNNALVAAPGEPGSPYAIGAEDGGHEAVHAELGGLDAFRRLLAAARSHGLEVALDFAVQCSPDHPWLSEHRGWFAKRADGSIRHAENPPKKYEDIVNVDFYADGAIPALWNALRDIALFWAGEGVRTFRVDNPHTKPLPFWEWLIASVRSRHPDVLFLSEAFTRPKPMYRLGKLGFSQSYTYFIWRNDKAGLTQYLQELNRGDPRECLRPNFFVNTPDINPYELQRGGRPAHLIRAALAALLSGLWGVYAGFELCESAALAGREEYLDSEKYQLRQRVRRRQGDIVDEIAALNLLRRTNPELQTHLDIEFLHADNDRVLYFAKGPSHARSRLLVAISLDGEASQSATIEVPLWRFGLADDAEIEVEALSPAARFRWKGKYQAIRLDPQQPFAVWRVFAPQRLTADTALENLS